MPTVITGANLVLDTTFVLETNPKTFLFTDSTDYSGASIALTGVRGDLKITSPSGTVIYENTSYGSASDIVANISLDNAIPIYLPCLSNQAPEQGIYTVVYRVQIIDGTNPTYYISQTNTYDLDYTSPVVCIVPQVDCISPLFTVADTTNYVVNSITPTNTRTITLEYPANSGGTAITNTTSATITTPVFYNGNQVTTVSSILSYAFSNFTVTDVAEGTKSMNVDCSFVCELYCCLKSLNNRVQSARGVNDILFEQLQSQFSQVMSLLELLFLAIDCGKQTDANALITYIKTLANCTDDCTCTDGSPTRVTGIGNLNNVNVIVQSGGSPISVIPVTSGGVTTYTISLSASIVTQLSTMYNTVVAAGSGISVVDSGIIAGTRTFTVSNSNTAQNRMEFLCRVQYTGTTSATVTNSAYLYSGSNMNATATVANPAIATAAANSYFLVNGFQVSANSNFKVTMELLIVTRNNGHGLNSLTTVQVEEANRSAGSFYFRFVGTNGVPITNSQMFTSGTTDLYVNIKISE